MIGAIKRRWKSKKAKVLHKGSELSTSSDSCPTSRGFAVDPCEDLDKLMMKPPSPRQVHPVLEKGDLKLSLGSHQQQHQLSNQALVAARKKSSTLPTSEEDCPFIRVNSGRIELVSKEKAGPTGDSIGQDKMLDKIGRLRAGRNDTRHSWCGSALRQEVREKRVTGMLVEPCGEESGVWKGKNHNGTKTDKLEEGLLKRLLAVEGTAGKLEEVKELEKIQYEKCVSDLTTQVSRAVAIQQMMKSEVEKLQQRVLELETHNKAMATMIIPTLVKLNNTVGQEILMKSNSLPKPEIKKNLPSPVKIQNGNSTKVSPSKVRSKADCRIPRMACQRNPPKPGEPSSIQTASLRSLTPSPKSESSSSTSKSGSSARSRVGLRPNQQKSSTYSGIPRSQLPSPKLPRSSANSSTYQIPKSPRKEPKDSSSPNKDLSSPNSKLPIPRRPGGSSPSRLPQPKSEVPSQEGKIVKGVNGVNGGKETNPVTVGAVETKLVGGKDEGYSTMSSEALAEQDVGKGEERNTQGIHKSATFNTFREIVGLSCTEKTDGGRAGIKKLIMEIEKRNFTTQSCDPKSSNNSSHINKNKGKPLQSATTNVRIIRGTPYEMDESEDSSTILWEDSDDSDILFLPLEMSSDTTTTSITSPSTASNTSSSTLVPDRSFPTSPDDSSSSSTKRGSNYPLRRSRGEDMVRLPRPTESEMEERALIEKWMRLEGSDVEWNDEWAWDWDGVERNYENAVSSWGRQKEEEDQKINTNTWTKKKKGRKEEESKLSIPNIESEMISIDFNDDDDCFGEEMKNELQVPLIVVSRPSPNGEYNGLGGDLEGEEMINVAIDSPPEALCDDGNSVAAIEFTPEYYTLVNYGSYGTNFLDQERTERKSRGRNSKMDDKIIQTDFISSSSSQENLSSCESSELFTECRNCLEIIRKLMVVGAEDPNELQGRPTGIYGADGTEFTAPTNWLPVPKGVPSTEVNRLLEILSSSESEDVLSPK